jgi:CheY-like chemotaxis protein
MSTSAPDGAGPRLAVQNTAPARPGRFELGAILLAEDHETSAFVICEALSAAGWVVETVPDAEGAIARAGQRRFQLILTDIHMPGGGESVLREIRSTLGPNRTAPVIAITADTSPERRAACLELGFSGLIEKPVRPRALVAAVADVLLAAGQERRAAG